MQAEGQPEGDKDIGDQDAGVDIGAKGESEGERGVESGVRVEVMASDGVRCEQQSETPSARGRRAAQSVTPKKFVAGGHAPVEQRRFFEIAQTVDVKSGPVVAEHHLAGGFGVDGIGIVEQGRGVEAGEIKGEPEKHDESDAKGVARRTGWLDEDARSVHNGQSSLYELCGEARI